MGTAPPPGRSDQAAFTVLIITGLSGSGKSTVLRALEDVGYFCIDNLPLSLLSPYLKEVSRSHRDHRNIALVMDVRTEGFLQNYAELFKDLAEGLLLSATEFRERLPERQRARGGVKLTASPGRSGARALPARNLSVGVKGTFRYLGNSSRTGATSIPRSRKPTRTPA